MGVNIGDINIPFVSTFSVDKSSKPTEQIKHLGNVPPHVAEFQADVLKFIMDGTLFQASGDVRDVDQYAGDITALVERFGVYNYIDDYQGRSGWLIIDSGDSDKSANSVLIRNYSLGGRFMPKNKYQARMHTAPVILTNDFSFSLGVDDCDNYIAIPIGATYSGGDGSTITRSSKDGTITLVLATTDSDINWDINEADVENGECKIFDMMSENLLKNDDLESWSAGASAAPDEWTYTQSGAGGGVSRSSTHKTGTYSTEITKSDSQNSFIEQQISGYEYYISKTVTIGCWVKSANTISNQIKIQIYDGVSSSSAYYQNSGDWEFLTITHTVDSSANQVKANLIVITGSDAVAYFDGAILVEGSACPTTPVLDTYGVQVYNRDQEFTGSMIIENGLYRIMLNPSTDHITIYYWDGSDYVYISAFTAGTYTRASIKVLNPDEIKVELDSGVEVEIRRGHPPMIDTGTTDLVTISLTPSDQSTTTENYLVLGTDIYICSDESFSLVNATKNCDDGKKWIFYETVGATAEDISHQAMVDQNLNRELIAR